MIDLATANSKPVNRPRNQAPIFIVGSPRSGTTLLYHMLLSAGGFAVYRTESKVFNLLEPGFGNLKVRRNRERLMQAWLHSKLFERSGLDAAAIREKVIAHCRDAGDFLRTVMEAIARSQGVSRWADCTPEHVLYLARIKQAFPDALIVHIIRDGRDAALSLEKQVWVRPLAWDRSRSLFASALYWEWMVRRGRKAGSDLGNDYREVNFEQLVRDPRGTLTSLGKFIEHDLDYDQILQAGIGSVSEPNTSFDRESGRTFNPVGRWQELLAPEERATLEALIGETLHELGYPLSSPGEVIRNRSRRRRLRASYFNYFDFKLWAKNRPLLGRWLTNKDLSGL